MIDKERESARKKAWRERNAERIRASREKYYAANHEISLAKKRFQRAEIAAHKENDQRNLAARTKIRAEARRVAAAVRAAKAKAQIDGMKRERRSKWDRGKCKRGSVLCENYIKCQEARLGISGVWIAPKNTDDCYKELEVRRNLFRSSLNGNINIGIR